MLRDAISSNTELGRKAKVVMDQGKLVGDDLVAGIVAEAIKRPDCQKGFILDGFPRTVKQAKILDELLAKEQVSVDKVINLQIDDELLIKRVTGRLVHLPSGRSYNIYFNPPKTEGRDDVTGEPIVRRGDDTEEKLRTRLAEFHSKTTPVLHYYRDKVVHIDASGEMSDITSNICEALSGSL
jgi:adenylate kinase